MRSTRTIRQSGTLANQLSDYFIVLSFTLLTVLWVLLIRENSANFQD